VKIRISRASELKSAIAGVGKKFAMSPAAHGHVRRKAVAMGAASLLAGAQLACAQLGWACLIAASIAISGTRADAPAEIHIPGDRVFPESLTSSANGTIYVGSVMTGAIFRATPGSDTANPWIKPGTDGLQNIFGVFADDRSRTLWVCSDALDPAGRAFPSHGELHAFDLKSGVGKGRYVFPTVDAYCNDIAVGSDNTVYATDMNNMQVVRLKPGAQQLDVWTPEGAFGPKGGALDGISVLKNAVFVNTLNSDQVFSVPIGSDGKAGPATAVKLDRKIDHPDGMRTFGKSGVLVVESGGPGRLSKIVFSADGGRVSTLKEGYPDGPVAVTVVGSTAYVLEAQFKALLAGAGGRINPFHATAVSVGQKSTKVHPVR
jgi:sugar lactone lactonase YvrE